ncbi:hypothetical protein ACEUZ9_004591 [Paracoccus litorisediminis]|uniref:hypothetical protein n=1 Tax=Paracoccus litorisediminis TaxID=2006130 RepID=UPI00372FB2C0
MQDHTPDEQPLPRHPARQRGTYPSGMERERRELAGGREKPKPSLEHRSEQAAKEEERNTQ